MEALQRRFVAEAQGLAREFRENVRRCKRQVSAGAGKDGAAQLSAARTLHAILAFAIMDVLARVLVRYPVCAQYRDNVRNAGEELVSKVDETRPLFGSQGTAQRSGAGEGGEHRQKRSV
jgi:hypothetical protein